MSYNVYLSLGSNIDPEHYVKRTVERLDDDFSLHAISTVHRTAPVAMAEDAGEFHNLCVQVETELDPSGLKDRLRKLEAELGRERSSQGELYESRVMDVDILIYEPEPEGFSPHEQIYDQAFVVYPLSEIYDPSRRDDLPETIEAWKENCDESVMLGTVDYDWPEELSAKVRR